MAFNREVINKDQSDDENDSDENVRAFPANFYGNMFQSHHVKDTSHSRDDNSYSDDEDDGLYPIKELSELRAKKEAEEDALPEGIESFVSELSPDQAKNIPRIFELLSRNLKLPENSRLPFFWSFGSLEKYTYWNRLDDKEKNTYLDLLRIFYASPQLKKYTYDEVEFISAFVLLLKEHENILASFNNLISDAQEKLILSIKRYYLEHKYDFSDGIPDVLFINLLYLQTLNVPPTIGYVMSDDAFVSFARLPRKLSGDVNLVKLHITLTWEDFIAHKDAFNKMLFAAIADGTIQEFKHIHQEAKEAIKQGRFVDGTQFTVYYPTENDSYFNIEKITDLCLKLDNYCKEHSLKGGTYAPIESPVSSFLTLRQDRVNGEYISASITDNDIIQSTKKLQEETELYKAVSSAFRQSLGLRPRSG